MDQADSSLSLQRSVSQHSATSLRSHRSGRSATVRGPRGRKRVSQPSSSSSSVAASDKSLTSFPSFSLKDTGAERFEEPSWSTPTAPEPPGERFSSRAVSGSDRASIVDNLTGQDNARTALFEDAPLVPKVPGALHQADDEHLQRLISRHGAIGLVRQISEDLAQRDAQISNLRRKADERERALRRIIRECGLSNLELETRLRSVEEELRTNGKSQRGGDNGLSDLMSDAMKDTVVATAYRGMDAKNSTIRASSQSTGKDSNNTENSKGTMRGWKDYLWGTGTAKRSRQDSVNEDSVNPTTVIRSHSSMDRRPTLQDDLFSPPEGGSVRSPSRASSIQSGQTADRKASTSLASLALRLVAGGAISTREAESRGRAVSTSARPDALRAASTTSNKTRAVSVAGGPKALMAMRRSTPAPQASAASRTPAQEGWEAMSPPRNLNSRQESYGPVEMDAIRAPETQPPTLTHIYNNVPNSEYLTDRFGFIYDQRRKKRQREASEMARHIRKSSRTEMIINGRSGVSPNLIDDVPSPKWSVSSNERPESPSSTEERGADEGKTKRWQDYLKIATFPTELLSHTPSIAVPSLQVMEGIEIAEGESQVSGLRRLPSITSTESGLLPSASTTTAVDSEISQPSQVESTATSITKEDVEPVKLLLQQLSEVHDALQREKEVRWNDFLRKVRAERRREGEAAIAAAKSAAEARYERPAMILPETRVADGEMIGVSGLGNKGKVGRAKWNEFKNLVLGGIPVAYRAKVWSECSGAAALRVPGYYDDLVGQSEGEDDPIVVSQIQMDIHRTMTDRIFFRKGPGVQKLNEVLLAYSRRNKDVGYCQGMNLITANLLLIMPSAEDAFWILTSIIENILPHGYYDHSLLASRADQQVLRQYVSSILPKLSAHLDSLAIELEALTFQWFLSVFTDCLSAEALFRVWDVVLSTNDGSTFLFQVALALLKLNEGNLLQCSTPAGVYTYINHQMTEHAISIDGLMQASDGLKKVVKREDVEQRREKAIKAEKDMVAARDSDSARSKTTQQEELSRVDPRPLED